MKRFICILLVMAIVCALCFALGGCANYDVWDMHYQFDKAIVKMPDGEVREIDIDMWADYEGEQIQIKARDGNVYLVSSFNCVLVDENN